MAEVAEETSMEHSLTVRRGRLGISQGSFLEFSNPPLDSDQKANLCAYGLPVDMGQEENSTKMFVTDQQAIEHFGDAADGISATELGMKVLKLSQQEGRVENGR